MSKPTIKDLQAELHSLKARHAVAQASNERLLKEIKRLKGSPKVESKLNMANATVAELMAQNAKLIESNDLHVSENIELGTEVETLKKEKETLENKGIADYESLFESYEKLKSDYAELEEKYYTQMDCYTEVNKEYKDLLDRFTEISAENHALKAEIERTNRHINLAENQLHKEQQPLVVNHYHNCTINK